MHLDRQHTEVVDCSEHFAFKSVGLSGGGGGVEHQINQPCAVMSSLNTVRFLSPPQVINSGLFSRGW